MSLLITLLIAAVVALLGKYLIDMFVTDGQYRQGAYIVLGIAILLYVLGFLRF